MKEILDDFSNEEEPVKPIFSKISFVFGIVSLLVAIVILFEFYELKKTLIPAYYIIYSCLLYTSPSPRDRQKSRMPSSA